MIEVEFKWTVKSQRDFERFLHAARALGASIGKRQGLQIRDLYWDTPDDFFSSQGIKSRLRRIGRQWEWTLKSRSLLKAGLARRQEENIALPKFKTEAAALRYLGVGFKKLFRVRNSRTLHPLNFPTKFSAEASFDDVILSRGRKHAKMREIELEFKKGSPKAFQSFCKRVTNQTKLLPAKKSKVATAYAVFFD